MPGLPSFIFTEQAVRQESVVRIQIQFLLRRKIMLPLTTEEDKILIIRMVLLSPADNASLRIILVLSKVDYVVS